MINKVVRTDGDPSCPRHDLQFSGDIFNLGHIAESYLVRECSH